MINSSVPIGTTNTLMMDKNSIQKKKIHVMCVYVTRVIQNVVNQLDVQLLQNPVIDMYLLKELVVNLNVWTRKQKGEEVETLQHQLIEAQKVGYY